LQLPAEELALIHDEAHLDREKQVHREDLYLEILDSHAAISKTFPQLARKHPRDEIIRAFARKREDGILKAVTDFRYVVRICKAVGESLVSHRTASLQVSRLITQRKVTPEEIWDRLGRPAEQQGSLRARAQLLKTGLASIDSRAHLAASFVRALRGLKTEIERLLP
jgi:hypothetical protein